MALDISWNNTLFLPVSYINHFYRSLSLCLPACSVSNSYRNGSAYSHRCMNSFIYDFHIFFLLLWKYMVLSYLLLFGFTSPWMKKKWRRVNAENSLSLLLNLYVCIWTLVSFPVKHEYEINSQSSNNLKIIAWNSLKSLWKYFWKSRKTNNENYKYKAIAFPFNL